jgi:hypothetical protein
MASDGRVRMMMNDDNNDEVKFHGHSVVIRDLLKLGFWLMRTLNLEDSCGFVRLVEPSANARTAGRIGAVRVSSIRRVRVFTNFRNA